MEQQKVVIHSNAGTAHLRLSIGDRGRRRRDACVASNEARGTRRKCEADSRDFISGSNRSHPRVGSRWAVSGAMAESE